MKAAGPRASTTARRELAGDDRAIAGPVAAVLVLALLVTLFADAALHDVPRWGAAAETAWDREVEAALASLASALGESVGRGSAVAGAIPPPIAAQRLEVPLLGGLDPLPASGSLAFDGACARWSAEHVRWGGAPVTDLAQASRGCLVFEGMGAYTGPFVYRLEHGALLRIQDGSAVIVMGPSLSLDATSPMAYSVGITIPSLRGIGGSASVTEGGVGVDLAARGSTTETSSAPNAASATWTIGTRYPVAWREWLLSAFDAAGFVASRPPAPGASTADHVVVCVPADCSLVAGMGEVRVVVEGPRIDRDDLRLAVSHGAFDVTLR